MMEERKCYDICIADNVQSNLGGIDNVGKNDSDLIIDIQLLEGLKHNLLSIS